MDYEILHYGVKGQKWGVRKETETSGRNSGAKDNSSIKEKNRAADDEVSLSDKNKALNLAANKQNFSNKFESDSSKSSSVSDKKGRRFSNKQIAKAVVGAAFVGLIIYGAHKNLKYPPPGLPVPNAKFNQAVFQSQMKSWTSADGSKFIQPSSFLQEDFSLPADHTFQRISTAAEHSFRNSTYTTASDADFNRYVSAFRKEKGINTTIFKTTFKANEEIRVSSLNSNLDAMKTYIKKSNYGYDPSDDEVRSAYTRLVGKDWNNHGDPEADGFIKELISRGYDAIIDDMDAGVIGEKPLVVINPLKFAAKQSTKMGASEIKSAENSLIELINRK